MALSTQYTAQAVREAAELVRAAWVAAATASALSPREQVRYIAGLTMPRSLESPVGGDAWQARVHNLAPMAPRLEYGFAAYHLPARIRWAQARGARRNKAGRWYLRVPFEHATPSAQRPGLPQGVYRVARRLQRGEYLTAGPTQGRAVHAPGLVPYVPRFARNVRPGYVHAALYEGLRRVPGRGRGSRYLTFRTLTQDSTGWWIPGRQGVQLARQTARDTAPAVRALIEAGIQQDLAAMLTPRRVGTP